MTGVGVAPRWSSGSVWRERYQPLHTARADPITYHEARLLVKYLILIHMDEKELEALPPDELNTLNKNHLRFNDELRASGHFVEAEALEPARTTSTVKVRGGKPSVMDGPFTESKEVVAGFYLVEARDMEEAIGIARRIPSAFMANIEVRPTRQLIVD